MVEYFLQNAETRIAEMAENTNNTESDLASTSRLEPSIIGGSFNRHAPTGLGSSKQQNNVSVNSRAIVRRAC